MAFVLFCYTRCIRDIWGAIFWDYFIDIQNINSQKNRLCATAILKNRIADVTKIKAMRPRKTRYAIFPPKDMRQLPKEHDYRLFCLSSEQTAIPSIPSILLSRAELTEYYSINCVQRLPRSHRLNF